MYYTGRKSQPITSVNPGTRGYVRPEFVHQKLCKRSQWACAIYTAELATRLHFPDRVLEIHVHTLYVDTKDGLWLQQVSLTH